MLLAVVVASIFLVGIEACIATSPMPGTPSPAMGTDICCQIDILDDQGTGNFLFHPQLRSCPATATLVCSVRVVGSNQNSVITVNGNTQVATSAVPNNAEYTLTYRRSDGIWEAQVQGKTVPVTGLRCDNN